MRVERGEMLLELMWMEEEHHSLPELPTASLHLLHTCAATFKSSVARCKNTLRSNSRGIVSTQQEEEEEEEEEEGGGKHSFNSASGSSSSCEYCPDKHVILIHPLACC